MKNVILLTVLATSAHAAPVAAPPPVRKAALVACETAIRASLKDPPSARVEAPLDFVSSQQGGWSATWWVNGKNSFGAYEGERRWMCVVDTGGTRVTSLQPL